jgi:hypothetical protein
VLAIRAVGDGKNILSMTKMGVAFIGEGSNELNLDLRQENLKCGCRSIDGKARLDRIWHILMIVGRVRKRWVKVGAWAAFPPFPSNFPPVTQTSSLASSE